MAVCLAASAWPLASVPGSADAVGSLLAQREALQQQVQSLGGQRAAALNQLLEVENALSNLRREIGANGARMAELNRQQSTLQERIAATEADLNTQRQMLRNLSRSQYKGIGNDGLAMVFSAKSFGEWVNHWIASVREGRSMGETAKKLKSDEAALNGLSADLARQQSAARALGAQLSQENGRLLALVAQHDAEVAGIDRSSQNLLGQIAGVNREIALATAPAPSYHGGSSGCGNHFDYGYCTWYVANRRCIPWFGNADEWWANARAYGYAEGQVPRPGAVAVWAAGGGYGGVGHVAYVESVQPDGFTVSEYNYTYGWNRYDTRFVSYSNRGPLDGFIYG